MDQKNARPRARRADSALAYHCERNFCPFAATTTYDADFLDESLAFVPIDNLFDRGLMENHRFYEYEAARGKDAAIFA